MSGVTRRFRDMLTIIADSSAVSDQAPVYDQIVRDKVPARVQAVTGGEIVRGRQIEADITHLIETRYYDGVKHEHIIKWKDETLYIDRILPDEFRREMTIMATVKRD